MVRLDVALVVIFGVLENPLVGGDLDAHVEGIRHQHRVQLGKIEQDSSILRRLANFAKG